jgi:hypothetical protein
LAGRVLLKIVYLLVRRVLGLFVLVFRKDLAKDAELLVLRHENAVLRRHAGRIRYEPADRVWFAAPARGLPGDTGDAAGLAPQAGRQEVRHEQTAQARPAACSPQHRTPGHPPGEGEPALCGAGDYVNARDGPPCHGVCESGSAGSRTALSST